jgi:multiple sugar transport system ATP-binding protein
MASLTLSGVTKSFGDLLILKGVDLDVKDGEFVVFVGPSGCGKSTLLRVIAGLERASGGTIAIDGRDVTAQRAAERGLAMVFQSYALYPHMSVRQNIAFALENLRMDRAEIAARVARAAKMLRLEDYLDRKPGALSGGQRQRVAIGRAVVRDPKIFLFDEPLSNLDAELRVATRRELAGLHAEIGGTMIYVTHDQIEAMTLADRIVVLNGGRIEQVGAPLELHHRPANLFVAGFIGSPKMNFLDASRHAGIARPFGTRTIGLRPEHAAAAGAAPPDARLRVTHVERLGGEAYAYGALEDGTEFCLRGDDATTPNRGDELGLLFDRSRLHFFDQDGRALRD